MTEEQNIVPPQPEIVDADWDPTEGTGVTDAGLPREKLRIAITGNNHLAVATEAAFDLKVAEVMRFGPKDDIQLFEYRPAVVFICDDIPMLKNDSLDDAALIATIQKIAQNTQAGICLKTTINTETLDRIINVVGIDWVTGKMIYSPEFSEDPEEILVSDLNYVGGGPKALDAFLNIIKHCTYTSTKEVVKGTLHEVIYAKLGVAGFRAVKQAFFNQFHQVILDLGAANPTIVRRMIERHPALQDSRVMLPSFIKAKTDSSITVKKARSYGGEYADRDVKMLVGQSDRITLLEEAVNLRNLKED